VCTGKYANWSVGIQRKVGTCLERLPEDGIGERNKGVLLGLTACLLAKLRICRIGLDMPKQQIS